MKIIYFYFWKHGGHGFAIYDLNRISDRNDLKSVLQGHKDGIGFGIKEISHYEIWELGEQKILEEILTQLNEE